MKIEGNVVRFDGTKIVFHRFDICHYFSLTFLKGLVYEYEMCNLLILKHMLHVFTTCNLNFLFRNTRSHLLLLNNGTDKQNEKMYKAPSADFFCNFLFVHYL